MMRFSYTLILLLISAIVLLACGSATKGIFPPEESALVKSIFLVSHGWHAGIVVKKSDIPEGIWPEHNDFPEATWLEIGWGDKDYYMTPGAHLGITLKAGLWPTASVLHVVAISEPITTYFQHGEVIRIDLSLEGFERLCRYIQESYAKDETNTSQPLGSGLYGNSQFYLSHESYHAFNTCNVWTARALREAGCPISPGATLTVDSLMSKAAEIGTVIRSKAPK